MGPAKLSSSSQNTCNSTTSNEGRNDGHQFIHKQKPPTRSAPFESKLQGGPEDCLHTQFSRDLTREVTRQPLVPADGAQLGRATSVDFIPSERVRSAEDAPERGAPSRRFTDDAREGHRRLGPRSCSGPFPSRWARNQSAWLPYARQWQY